MSYVFQTCPTCGRHLVPITRAAGDLPRVSPHDKPDTVERCQHSGTASTSRPFPPTVVEQEFIRRSDRLLLAYLCGVIAIGIAGAIAALCVR